MPAPDVPDPDGATAVDPRADLAQLRIARDAPAAARQRRLRWWHVAVPVALLAVAVGVRLGARPTVSVTTVTQAWPAQDYTLLNATGYVVAQRKAALSSKATGRLEWLGVLEGSRVREGEVVARLESRDVAAALGQARANVQVAQATQRQGEAELRDARQARERASGLLAQRFIAPATHDAAVAREDKALAAVAAQRAAVVAARAAARAAEVAVEQTLIRAPFDAVVLTKSANVGDNITPFSSAADSKGAVVTIADMATLEVEADVAEASLARIGAGQPAEIQLDAFPGVRLAGTVSRMVPTLDRSKATLLVKVRFDERDPRVLPDMSARVAFLRHPVPPADRRPVTAVQPAAIVQRGGTSTVYVVRDGAVHPRAVTPGRRIGDLVALSGVPAGARVALRPDAAWRDGQRVAEAQP